MHSRYCNFDQRIGRINFDSSPSVRTIDAYPPTVKDHSGFHILVVFAGSGSNCSHGLGIRRRNSANNVTAEEWIVAVFAG